jgi:hypothetical protein
MRARDIAASERHLTIARTIASARGMAPELEAIAAVQDRLN